MRPPQRCNFSNGAIRHSPAFDIVVEARLLGPFESRSVEDAENHLRHSRFLDLRDVRKVAEFRGVRVIGVAYFDAVLWSCHQDVVCAPDN